MAVLSVKKYTKYTLLTLLLSATALSAYANGGEPFYQMGEDEDVGASEPYNYEYLGRYYKMNFDAPALDVNDTISWSDGDGYSSNVQMKIPNDDTRYFKPIINEDSSVVAMKHAENGAVLDNTDPNYGHFAGDNFEDSFFYNYASPYSSSTVEAKGGVIYNHDGGKIDDMYRNEFVGNQATAGSIARGGVIYNGENSEIGDIESINFMGNYVRATAGGQGVTVHAQGGAVYNTGTLGDIHAEFISNYADGANAEGGAIYNAGKIETSYGDAGTIVGDFVSNYARGAQDNAKGGAIYNEGETALNAIGGNFIGNYARANYSGAYGGAIANYQGPEINWINSNFIGNYARGNYAEGGAISNYYDTIIDRIDGKYIQNEAVASIYNAYGGAISNSYDSIINELDGMYYNNKAVAENKEAYGGAISNYGGGRINEVVGDFVRNVAKGDYAEGGAISNDSQSTIGTINSEYFVENKAEAKNDDAFGGAISNANGAEIETISDTEFTKNIVSSENGSAFGGAISNGGGAKIGTIQGTSVYSSGVRNEENKAVSENGNAYGGAIYNGGEISEISNILFYENKAEGENIAQGGVIFNDSQSTIGGADVSVIRNSAYAENGNAYGGAISNANGAEIGTLSGKFEGNEAVSENGNSFGGAIYNAGEISEIKNATFYNNRVIGGSNSQGGAIYTKADLFLNADGEEIEFSGNNVNGKSSSIYTDQADLKTSATNNGYIGIYDNLDGNNYNWLLDGDETGVIRLSGEANNVNNLNFSNNVVLNLGHSTIIKTKNMKAESGANPTLKIDLWFNHDNEGQAQALNSVGDSVNSGVINVSNQVSGDYNVIVSTREGEGYDGAKTVFVNAPNDTNPNDESFNVSRVIGSPYAWSALRNVEGTESGSVWYLTTPDGPIPPGPTPTREVTPEVIAGIGMQEAAVSQIRNLGRTVGNKLADSKLSCPGCGIVNYGWKNRPLKNVWINAEGESLKSENAVDMDGKIWGVDAGFDLQADMNNAIGIFGSYRKGKYDYNGDGDKYYSKTGSDIDMDSYLGGLYYRYDRNMNWALAMVYGGALKADVSTDDHIAKYDTDGYLIGAGLQFGHDFAIANGLLLEPSLGLYYNYISFDDATDNVGKEYRWDDMQYAEAEFGLKLEKQLPYQSKLYIKPSVIQTWRDGNSVRISRLNKPDTGDNQTLGRVEIGGRVGFTNALSGYTWANYTFGEHGYEATAAGAGLNYSW